MVAPVILFVILSSSALALLLWKNHHDKRILEKRIEKLNAQAAAAKAFGEFMPQLVFVIDGSGHPSFFNRQWVEYTGCDLDTPMTWETLIHKEDVVASKSHWEDCFKTLQHFQTESRLKRVDGVYRWFLVRATPILDWNGKLLRWVGTCTDIEEHKAAQSSILRLVNESKQAQKLIKESEAKFRQLSDSMPQIVWSANAEGVTDYCNLRWYEFTGHLTPSKSVNENWLPIVHPDDRARTMEVWETSVKTGTPFQIEYRFWDRKSQSYRWHLGRALAVRNDQGKITRWFGTCTDINGQKNLELEQQKLVSLVENSSDFIGICDLNQNILFLNKAGLDVVGQDHFEGIKVKDFFEEQDYQAIREQIIPTVLHKGRWEGEIALLNAKTKQKTPFWTTAFTINDSSGKPVGLATVSRNLLERKTAEEEKIKLLSREQAALDASRMKSAFLANTSHEIRTPLNGIIGMTSLLLRTELDARQLEYASTIRSSAEILLNLLNDILDFSKVEAGKLGLEAVNFDLLPLTQSVSSLFLTMAQEKGLTLITDIPEESIFLRSDPTRIRQILNNLISNANKFTESGTVRLSLHCLPTTQGGFEIRGEVSDTGIGMNEETQNRLFQSFTQADSSTTRKYGGTGLGLAICKRIVELMSGEIGVKSAPKKGSTFWFRIPCEKSTEGQAIEKTPGIHTRKQCRVLVAEDNPVNQRLAQLLLEDLKQKVVCVTTGREVIEKLKSEKFDLILMDCQMPEMDGMEATRWIRASQVPNFCDIPIIAMTANAYAEDKEKCLEAGMNDYLSKPFTHNEFARVLSRWLPRRKNPDVSALTY